MNKLLVPSIVLVVATATFFSASAADLSSDPSCRGTPPIEGSSAPMVASPRSGCPRTHSNGAPGATNPDALDRYEAAVQDYKAEKAIRVPASELGLSGDVDMLGNPGSYNGWSGYIGGKFYSVAAGYEFEDPRQGVVFILEGSETGRGPYLTPKPLGPSYIVGVANGVVRLKTKGGHFCMTDPNSDKQSCFDFRGGDIFSFDIRSQTFR